jgi:hypothetical protein
MDRSPLAILAELLAIDKSDEPNKLLAKARLLGTWERDTHNKALSYAEVAVQHAALDRRGRVKMSLADSLRAIDRFRIKWKQNPSDG